MNKTLRLIIIAVCGSLLISLIFNLFSPMGLILTKNKAQRIMDDAVAQTVELMEDENLFKDTLSENLSITVLSIKLSKDGYRGSCLVKSVYYEQALLDYFSEVSSDEVASVNDIITRLETIIEKAPTTEKVFEVDFIRTDEGYTPAFTEEMVDFCSGSTRTVQENLIKFIGLWGLK